METVAAAAIIVIQVGTYVLSHVKGKKGSVNMDGKLLRLGQDLRTAMDVSHQSLSQEVQTLATEVRKDIGTLSAHVIGPDGQNGLRGDVRKLQTEIAELAPRKLKGGRR